MATHSVVIAPASRRALAVVQDWTRSHLLQPVEGFIKTVNGQAAHAEIKTYMLENEAVHTALVTRLLQAERRIQLLTQLVAVLVVAEILHWVLR